jgi:ketosteroid isomerase-like protein
MSSAEHTVLAAIAAVEERDLDRLAGLYDPGVRFHWPPGLPYSGRYEGKELATMTQRFSSVWQPLQPTEEQRRMEPSVVATCGDTVVLQYVTRGVDAGGRTFETPVLARYRAREGRLLEAQMFYWDLVGLRQFLETAGVASD